jgi:hypothetical protein
MAVSKKQREFVEPETTPVKGGKEEKFSVMLGNDCQRYMTPKLELFIAGKRYSMGAGKRRELFNYADENGIRFFYDAEVIEMQIAAAKKRGRRYTEAEEGTDTAEGVTTLQDDEGEDVGKTGSISI